MSAASFEVVGRRASDAPLLLELVWAPGPRPGLLRRVDPVFEWSAAAAEGLRREIVVARQAPVSPYLVPFLAADDGRRPWLLREWKRGASLDSLLAGGALLRGTQVLTLATDALAALDVLHGAGIVHGDPSPSNFLLDERGRPRLADPGSARRLFARGRGAGVDGPVADLRKLMAWLVPLASALPPEDPLSIPLRDTLAAERVESSFRAIRALAAPQASDPLLPPFPVAPPKRLPLEVALLVGPVPSPSEANEAARALAALGLGEESQLAGPLLAWRRLVLTVTHPDPLLAALAALTRLGVRSDVRDQVPPTGPGAGR